MRVEVLALPTIFSVIVHFCLHLRLYAARGVALAAPVVLAALVAVVLAALVAVVLAARVAVDEAQRGVV